MVVGCGESPPAPDAARCEPVALDAVAPPPGAPPSRLAAVVSDYRDGRVRFVDLAALTESPDALPASGDTVVRAWGTTLALLDRHASAARESLTLYDLATSPPRLVGQTALLTAEERARDPRRLAPANAHDALAVSARKAYVARWSLPSLAVVNLDARCVASTVDLSDARFRGAAALPYPDALALVDGMVWVTLERLDDLLAPRQNGAVVVLDPRTDAVTDVIALPHPNPLGPIHTAPGSDGARRWVVTVGDYHVLGDGGVVEIDAATRRVTGDVVTETDVGGNIDGLAPLGGTRMLLRVSGAQSGTANLADNRLVEVDLAITPRRPREWLRTPQWSPATPVVAPDGRVFVGVPGDPAARTPGRVRVYRNDGTPERELPLGSVGEVRAYDLALVP